MFECRKLKVITSKPETIDDFVIVHYSKFYNEEKKIYQNKVMVFDKEKTYSFTGDEARIIFFKILEAELVTENLIDMLGLRETINYFGV